VQDLNILSLFWQAGIVVKLVMLLLLSFSGLSWFIVYQKFILFRDLKLESAQYLEFFWNSKNLADAHREAKESPCPEAAIFQTGYAELQKLEQAQQTDANKDKTLQDRLAGLDNLKRVLSKTSATQSAALESNLSFLATTGSATPFIGLFGTVWGIMVSFNEIGTHGSASLAVVAPGISEALVATAGGLGVAIPAVIFFNYFSNKLGVVENEMDNFSTDFLNLVERDRLTRGQ
jgi:biopolymer transport protein TolQ